MSAIFPVHGKHVPQPGILLVDHAIEEQRSLMDLLRAHHFKLSLAFDGKQAYQRALATQPGLILLETELPRMDGFSVCRLLKADPATRDIPVIFLTSNNRPEHRIEGLTVGAVDYISKPYESAEVLARIRIHLELAARCKEVAAPAANPTVHHPDMVVFNAASKLISERLRSIPSLAEIARMTGTHEKKLSHIFRQQTGQTVFAFIREERIQHGRKLLSDTDLSVQEIADQVGFQNACNFSTAFKERFQMTPSRFRQALRSAGEPEPEL